MQIHIIPCGFLKARATEMIKPLEITLINKKYQIDARGYIQLSLNALLVLEQDRVVLFDPGCAEFLPSRLLKEYGLEIPVSLEEELQKTGVKPDQVTDVIFTHLHFDHGSGAFVRVPGKIMQRFKNARYHVLKEHYEYASRPNPEESNSFFTLFLKYANAIYWLEDWKEKWLDFQVFNGHTHGMVVPSIRSEQTDVYYLTDLIPLELFLEMGVYSGYDLDGKLAVQEKVNFLTGLDERTQLIFFHDPLINSVIYP